MSKYNVSCPSGFPEWTPAQERVYQQWIRVIREVFERNGFMSITTPLVERAENLLAKGGNGKEMYALKRLLDEEGNSSHSGNALRFDHTVPLALYVARHLNAIAFPFRRYAIGPVLRGERAQKGRFRQFDQCDIDVIGSGELSLMNDAMVAAVIIQIFEKLLEGKNFVLRLNNRKILTTFFTQLKIAPEKVKNVFDMIDDLEKVGKKTGEKNLLNKGFSSEVVQKILAFAEISGNNDEILDKVENIVGDITTELREVIHALRSMKIDEKRFKVDLSIARGLDYYTGTVYETSLVGYENLGSICSGGRYDDLAEIFTGKKLPGVGISIGLTRLLSQFFDGGLVEVDRSSPSQFLVIAASQNAKSKCLEIATHVRDLGYRVENYLEDKKIRKQFDYADKLGIPYVLIMGEDELEKNIIQLKNMKSGKQTEINLSDIEHILEDVVG